MASLYVCNSCMWQQGLLHSKQGQRRPAALPTCMSDVRHCRSSNDWTSTKIRPGVMQKIEMLGESTVACMHDTHVFSTWTDGSAQTQQQQQTAITLT